MESNTLHIQGRILTPLPYLRWHERSWDQVLLRWLPPSVGCRLYRDSIEVGAEIHNKNYSSIIPVSGTQSLLFCCYYYYTNGEGDLLGSKDYKPQRSTEGTTLWKGSAEKKNKNQTSKSELTYNMKFPIYILLKALLIPVQLNIGLPLDALLSAVTFVTPIVKQVVLYSFHMTRSLLEHFHRLSFIYLQASQFSDVLLLFQLHLS